LDAERGVKPAIETRWSSPMVQAAEQVAEKVREPKSTLDATPDAAPDAIAATLNYIVNDGSKIFTETAAPGATDVRTGGKPDARSVTIRNGRVHARDFTIERNGFHFIPHDTAVTDFFDDAQVRGTYYAEMEALVKRESGASRVVVFDHTLRTADQAQREALKIREVVPRVHNDYTEWSGPQRVRDLLPQEADDLLARRFAIIQVWRPIRHPVETFPLAICDARTVSPDNMVISERRYPNRIGQTYAITYNPEHAWYWFPRMRRNEALVFKVYDSLTDGRARWTAHTAFQDPTSPPNARPRESIEIRTLAFF
jgi:hypothetical protein